MINALILEDHHEYIDPNLWYGWHRKSGEPALIVVHNKNGVFVWIRHSIYFNSRYPEYSRDDWMEICRTCGLVTKVGSNFECNDHFAEKMKAAFSSPEFAAALESARARQ